MSFIGAPGDHLPLSDAIPLDGSKLASLPQPNKPSSTRNELPFGLRFATTMRAHTDTDVATVRYDERLQLSTTYTQGQWVPLITIAAPLTVQSTGEVASPNFDEIFDKN
ncbi:MAG: hypothetical protein DLM55_03810 [Acidimicrobiales bacterium]|nr:MAG: hypothetical protein DLM55_03810 [Acidimicrobiales bacterium]